jgi:hypothetical protein
MTPDASKAAAADDDGRIHSIAFLEFGSLMAMDTAKLIALTTGITFIAAFWAYQWKREVGLWFLVFGPLLTVHLHWAWFSLVRISVLKKGSALPLWERHRLDLMLRGVYNHLSKKAAK